MPIFPMQASDDAVRDTWGIPGPEFSMLYIMGMLVLAVLVPLTHYLLSGRGGSFGDGDRALLDGLEPEQIALLTRDDAAVGSALASVIASGGTVSMTRRPRQPVADANVPLRVAVHHARATGRAQTFEALTRDPEVRQALNVTRADLRARGLYLSSWRFALLRARCLLPIALTLIGIARVIAGWQNHKPISQIVIETLIMACCTAISAWSCYHASPATRPARAALDDLRRSSAKLLPEAMTRRGVGSAKTRALAPMSVALFGTAALVHADPDLAGALAIPTVQYATISGHGIGSSASSNSCSSSSSCGDGGCGSSSSCGG